MSTIKSTQTTVKPPASGLRDSGARQTFETGGMREPSTGKGRYDLLPPEAVARLARHYENGAKKYGDRNWEKGLPVSRCVDSAFRHMFQWANGDREEDHLAAVLWNVAAIITTLERVENGQLPEALNDMPHKGDYR